MDYSKIKCLTCKHCERESFIPHGHSEYTPELGDWECAKNLFESSCTLPDILECEQHEHSSCGYKIYDCSFDVESNATDNREPGEPS
jgi:hypothetical protein